MHVKPIVNIWVDYIVAYVIALTSEALLKVVLIALESKNYVVEFLSLGAKLFALQSINRKRLDALLENGLPLGFQLLFRLLNLLVFDFFNLLQCNKIYRLL